MTDKVRHPAAGIAIDNRRLRGLREQKPWSRTVLSRKSGVGISAIAAIENGRNRPRPETLRRLCEALAITPEELLKKTGE